MAQSLPPIALRTGFTRPWGSVFFSRIVFQYNEFFFRTHLVCLYIEGFFKKWTWNGRRSFFINYLFSHVDSFWYSNRLHLNVYLYSTKYQYFMFKLGSFMGRGKFQNKEAKLKKSKLGSEARFYVDEKSEFNCFLKKSFRGEMVSYANTLNKGWSLNFYNRFVFKKLFSRDFDSFYNLIRRSRYKSLWAVYFSEITIEFKKFLALNRQTKLRRQKNKNRKYYFKNKFNRNKFNKNNFIKRNFNRNNFDKNKSFRFKDRFHFKQQRFTKRQEVVRKRFPVEDISSFFEGDFFESEFPKKLVERSMFFSYPVREKFFKFLLCTLLMKRSREISLPSYVKTFIYVRFLKPKVKSLRKKLNKILLKTLRLKRKFSIRWKGHLYKFRIYRSKLKKKYRIKLNLKSRNFTRNKLQVASGESFQFQKKYNKNNVFKQNNFSLKRGRRNFSQKNKSTDFYNRQKVYDQRQGNFSSKQSAIYKFKSQDDRSKNTGSRGDERMNNNLKRSDVRFSSEFKKTNTYKGNKFNKQSSFLKKKTINRKSLALRAYWLKRFPFFNEPLKFVLNIKNKRHMLLFRLFFYFKLLIDLGFFKKFYRFIFYLTHLRQLKRILFRFFVKDFYFIFGFSEVVNFERLVSLNLKMLKSSGLTSEALAKHLWLKLTKKYSFGFVIQSMIKNFKKTKFFRGMLFRCNGRFTKKQKAWHSVFRYGRVPLSTLRLTVDDFYIPIRLKYGIGSIRINITYFDRKFPRRRLRRAQKLRRIRLKIKLAILREKRRLRLLAKNS